MPLVMGLVGLIGLLIFSAVGITDLAGMFKTMRRERTRDVAPQPVPAIDQQAQARLTELARQGNKIKAISELMAATGLGLKDAKDAVDAIAAGHDISEMLLPRQDVPADMAERARDLIAQGRKIQAVKLIREETGLGLKDAKDIADGLGGLR
jgi:ribosomal protein L7/L12